MALDREAVKAALTAATERRTELRTRMRQGLLDVSGFHAMDDAEQRRIDRLLDELHQSA